MQVTALGTVDLPIGPVRALCGDQPRRRPLPLTFASGRLDANHSYRRRDARAGRERWRDGLVSRPQLCAPGFSILTSLSDKWPALLEPLLERLDQVLYIPPRTLTCIL
jgi:hypothetical protein